MTEPELTQTVLLSDGTGLKPMGVRMLANASAEGSQENLAVLLGTQVPSLNAQDAALAREMDALEEAGLEAMKKSGIESVGPLPGRTKYLVAEQYKDEVERRMVVGGESCDRCMTHRTTLDDAKLKRCSRCKNAFYCSASCQKAAWVGGHKAACRAP